MNGDAVGYMRSSVSSQESIILQEQEIRAICRDKGFNLLEFYTDLGLPEDITERLSLTKMLNNLKKGQVVVIHDLSRLSRNTRDAMSILDSIHEKGCKLVCKNLDIDFSSPIGEFIYTMLIAVNKMEWDRTNK